MPRTWTEGMSAPLVKVMLSVTMSAMLAAVFTGCATRKEELLPRGEHNMLDIWHRETAGASAAEGSIDGGTAASHATRQLLDARLGLRRPLTSDAVETYPAAQAAYTRTATNEIYRQFHRLPNPDLVMYVFPHLAGTEEVPAPGYSTVFPMHPRVHYAMPGDRLEAP